LAPARHAARCAKRQVALTQAPPRFASLFSYNADLAEFEATATQTLLELIDVKRRKIDNDSDDQEDETTRRKRKLRAKDKSQRPRQS